MFFASASIINTLFKIVIQVINILYEELLAKILFLSQIFARSYL